MYLETVISTEEKLILGNSISVSSSKMRNFIYKHSIINLISILILLIHDYSLGSSVLGLEKQDI